MTRISAPQREKVRRALLASAARHFAEHGLEGANVNHISVDAGFAKGTIYNYFASKEELFSAVLAAGSEHTIARYRAMSVTGGTREHLRAIAQADADLVRDHQDVMKTFVRELVTPREATRSLIDAALAPLVWVIAERLAQGQASGEVRADQPAPRLALVFLGQLTMAYVQNWRTDGAWPPWDEMGKVVTDLFLAGCGSPGNSPP